MALAGEWVMRHDSPDVTRWRSWAALGLTTFVGIGCDGADPGDTIVTGAVTATTGDDGDVAPDDTPVVRAEVPPPPISGGTLLVTGDGEWIVASDPDRATVFVVDLHAEVLTRAIEVQEGDEPGRLVEDADGRVHVAMRRSGDVVTIDPATGETVARRFACANPRGIAYDELVDALWVACAEGALVQLPSEGSEDAIVWPTDVDVRDVIVPTDEEAPLVVTRFREADILHVGAAGTVLERESPFVMRVTDPGEGLVSAMKPVVAWRTRPHPDGGWIMVHQLATSDALDIAPEDDGSEPPYGGDDPGGCNDNTGVAVTLFHGDQTMTTYGRIRDAVLPVDLAVDSEGVIAIAIAGAPEGAAAVRLVKTAALRHGFGGSCDDPTSVDIPGQPVAVEFTPDRRLVVQSREPASVFVFDPGAENMRTIALSARSVRDTGHELFHLDAGQGVSCATCHPEGGDDGFTWNFSPIGPRRTQPLQVGLRGTEPFHWEGDQADLRSLLAEVHQRRMGGRPQSEERLAAFESWLHTLQPPAASRSATDDAVQRGRAAFEALGCASCHTGSMLTNATSVAMPGNADLMVQVPTLRAVALRPPYMHDGRADTLRDAVLDMLRFSTLGSNATQAQIDDVVAYLQSL